MLHRINIVFAKTWSLPNSPFKLRNVSQNWLLLTKKKVSKSSSPKHLGESGLVDASKDPVDDLEKGDDAESKTETKEPSKGGNEVHWTHSDASLKL